MDQQTSTAAPPPSYWRETRQPIYSALLILPFLLLYEVGLVFLRSDVINGGHAILLHLGGSIMRLLGLHASFASVLALIILFIVAQVRRKGSWRVRPPALVALFLESLAYAVILFLLLGYFVRYLPRDRTAALPQQSAPAACALAAGPAAASSAATARPSRPGVNDFVLYCGAGVYEELVFRVILLGLLMLVFTKLFHMEHAYAAVWSVVAGAVIFSSFHHIGGQPFAFGMFSQRVFAGIYFAAVYFNRSFGLAAASHAFYDILVGLSQYV